jgi:hypothetical protein
MENKQIERGIKAGHIKAETTEFHASRDSGSFKREVFVIPYVRYTALTSKGAEILAQSEERMLQLFNWAFDLEHRNDLRNAHLKGIGKRG